MQPLQVRRRLSSCPGRGGSWGLLMWIKTLRSTPPITGFSVMGWDKSPLKALSKVGPHLACARSLDKTVTAAIRVVVTPSDLQLSTKVVPGCPLSRHVPGWFLWAPASRSHPTGVSGEHGWWWWSQGAFCWGAWGMGTFLNWQDSTSLPQRACSLF